MAMRRAADHVGRIGALAVALGVGAAVVIGQAGVARADESTSSGNTSESADAQNDAQAPGSSADGQDASTTPDRPDSQVGGSGEIRDANDDAEEADTQEDDTESDDDGDEDRRDSRRSSETDEDAAGEARSPQPRIDAEAAPAVEPAPPEVDEFDGPTQAPDAAPQAAEPAATEQERTVAVDSEPAEPAEPEPAAAPADVVTNVLTAVFTPLAADTGDLPTPADPPVAWVLTAAARREIGGAFADHQTDAGFAMLAAHATVAEEPVFTGQPSLITQVFVAGLRLIKPILNLFGIELNGTSARVPFFTDGVPPFFVTYGLNVRSDEYDGWKVRTLAPRNPSEKVVVAMHGGSFISTASLFHWSTYSDLARATNATVVVPLYPLANAQGTGGTAKTVVPVMADFLAAQIAEHGAENVSVLGDSAGGSIALATTQELVRRCKAAQNCDPATTLPGRMVLLAPALDSSLSNPAVYEVDDPLLSPASSKRNGLWWSKGLETAEDPDGTRNPLSSPLFGDLDLLPPTTVYAGSLDLRTPDVLLLREKALAAGADFTFELRNGQIHDWVIFGFLPDAQREKANIYRDLGLTKTV